MSLRRILGPLLLAAVTLSVASSAPAQGTRPHRAGHAYANLDAWRFRHSDRPVKVVLLAGSIGAHPDRPYARLLHEWCSEAEIQNLSQVGRGAPALVQSFRQRVVNNPVARAGVRAGGLWVLWGGGMNSVAAPSRSNHALRNLFRLAHRRGIRVVALTLTPWGDDDTLRGGRGVHLAKATRRMVDFVLGRLSPPEALGDRANGQAEWRSDEHPDVTIDLYDSPLRDRSAQPRPVDAMRRTLERDRSWRLRNASLDGDARAAQLEADARMLSEMPRWYLRSELRGFDSVHLNSEGHRAIAEQVCPELPASWGCRCPPRPAP